MQGRSELSYWMKDSTIITLAFMGLCVVVLGCLSLLIMCGHDGDLVKAMIGIAVAVFGGNFWHLFKKH
jgi:hypothetical protein